MFPYSMPTSSTSRATTCVTLQLSHGSLALSVGTATSQQPARSVEKMQLPELSLLNVSAGRSCSLHTLFVHLARYVAPHVVQGTTVELYSAVLNFG